MYAYIGTSLKPWGRYGSNMVVLWRFHGAAAGSLPQSSVPHFINSLTQLRPS